MGIFFKLKIIDFFLAPQILLFNLTNHNIFQLTNWQDHQSNWTCSKQLLQNKWLVKCQNELDYWSCYLVKRVTNPCLMSSAKIDKISSMQLISSPVGCIARTMQTYMIMLQDCKMLQEGYLNSLLKPIWWVDNAICIKYLMKRKLSFHLRWKRFDNLYHSLTATQ
jgi:hypothetical protein